MEQLKAIRVWVFVLGLMAIFSAERYFTSQAPYGYLLGLGILGGILGITLSVFLSWKAQKDGKIAEASCWRSTIAWKVLVAFGVSFYFLYKWQLAGAAAPEQLSAKVLLWLYLSFLSLGLLTGVGVELSHRVSGEGETAEPKRLHESFFRWMGLGFLLLGLFALNYASQKQDKVFDVSYFKTTKPGESTLKIVAGLQQPVKVGVFFSKDSEVLPYVKEYLDYAAKQSKQLEIAYFDKDFQPLQAEEYRVSKNGQIVLSRDGRRQRIDLGDKLENARSKLKSLDKDFQKNLLTLTAEPKNVYFLANHGEMSWSLDKHSPPRTIRGLEAVLRSQNLNPRTLGTAFASIPDDAAIVVLASPISNVLPEEVQALRSYLQKGGKLLVILDIEFGGERPEGIEVGEQAQLTDFLRELGVEYRRDPLVSDQDYINQGRGSKLDKLLLYTNVFGSHESVSTLTRNDDKLSVFTFYSGALAVVPSSDQWKTSATIMSMRSTYQDKNKNLSFDEGLEKKESLPLGVAVEKDLPDGKKAKVLVFADATMFSDPLMGNGGNQLMALDSFRWLSDRADISGAIESEEDVKIQHSKGRELFVFMGSIYAFPIIILGMGYWVNRRRRSRA